VVAFITGVYFIVCALFFTGQTVTTLVIGLILAVALWVVGENTVKRDKRTGRLMQIAAGVALGITLLLIRDNLALVTGVIAGTLLMTLGAFAAASVTSFVLNFVALITGFNAINDITSLWNNTSASLVQNGQVTRNDAAVLASYTNLPVQLWLIVWIVLALAMMGAAVYFALIRPSRATTV